MVRRPLTREEANRLRHAAQSLIEKLIVSLALDCGLRVSEIAGLTDRDCDYYARPPRLRIECKGRQRVVPLPEAAARGLEAWLMIHDRMPSVRTVQRIIGRLARKARIGRPVSPHVLRHTFAVHQLERGLSLPALQALLGHSDLATTAVYLRLSNEEAIREWTQKQEAQ
jgi:integrase/recombinase XerD